MLSRHLVELAVAGGAQAIVTKNTRDVAKMELRFPNLRVATPAELVKE
jgi:predicted nucleic acid-binding protein